MFHRRPGKLRHYPSPDEWAHAAGMLAVDEPWFHCGATGGLGASVGMQGLMEPGRSPPASACPVLTDFVAKVFLHCCSRILRAVVAPARRAIHPPSQHAGGDRAKTAWVPALRRPSTRFETPGPQTGALTGLRYAPSGQVAQDVQSCVFSAGQWSLSALIPTGGGPAQG
jgi:hypothetical protein